MSVEDMARRALELNAGPWLTIGDAEEQMRLLPELAQAVLDLSATNRTHTAMLDVSADNAEFFVAQSDELRAEVERMKAKPIIEPGGFVWVTGWLPQNANPAHAYRYFLAMDDGSDEPVMDYAWVVPGVQGGWIYSGCGGHEVATEAGARSAAEKWVEETYGAGNDD